MIIDLQRIRIAIDKIRKRLRAPRKALPVVEWHSWFAWRPVRVTPDAAVWMERVDRCRLRANARWTYRFSGKQKERGPAPF